MKYDIWNPSQERQNKMNVLSGEYASIVQGETGWNMQ